MKAKRGKSQLLSLPCQNQNPRVCQLDWNYFYLAITLRNPTAHNQSPPFLSLHQRDHRFPFPLPLQQSQLHPPKLILPLSPNFKTNSLSLRSIHSNDNHINQKKKKKKTNGRRSHTHAFASRGERLHGEAR